MLSFAITNGGKPWLNLRTIYISSLCVCVKQWMADLWQSTSLGKASMKEPLRTPPPSLPYSSTAGMQPGRFTLPSLRASDGSGSTVYGSKNTESFFFTPSFAASRPWLQTVCHWLCHTDFLRGQGHENKTLSGATVDPPQSSDGPVWGVPVSYLWSSCRPRLWLRVRPSSREGECQKCTLSPSLRCDACLCVSKVQIQVGSLRGPHTLIPGIGSNLRSPQSP